MIDDSDIYEESQDTVDFSQLESEEREAPVSHASHARRFRAFASLFLFFSLLGGLAAGVFGRMYLPTSSIGPILSREDGLAVFASRFVEEAPQRGQLKIRVFEDVNGNGKREDSERGIEQVQIALGPQGTSHRVSTNYNGEAALYDLSEGSYAIDLEWSFTSLPNVLPRTLQQKLYTYKGKPLPIKGESIAYSSSASTLDIPLQKYIPRYIMAAGGNSSDTVVFYDPEIQRQIGWVRTTDRQNQYKQNIVSRDGYLYFMNDGGDLERYSWIDDKIEVAIRETGLSREGGFEYWKLSPEGKTVLIANRSGSLAQLRVRSSMPECDRRDVITYNDKPLRVQTSSNPYAPFLATFADERRFFATASTEDDTLQRLFVFTCESGGWKVTRTNITTPSQLRFAGDNKLLVGPFSTDNESLPTRNAVYALDLSTMEAKQVSDSSLSLTPAQTPDWLLRVTEQSVALRLLPDVRTGKNQPILADLKLPGSYALDYMRMADSVQHQSLFVLEKKTCVERNCGQVYRLQLDGNRLVTRDSWVYQDTHYIFYGMLRGRE